MGTQRPGVRTHLRNSPPSQEPERGSFTLRRSSEGRLGRPRGSTATSHRSCRESPPCGDGRSHGPTPHGAEPVRVAVGRAGVSWVSRFDAAVLPGVLEGAARLTHDGGLLQLDHRLLDVGVDAAKPAAGTSPLSRGVLALTGSRWWWRWWSATSFRSRRRVARRLSEERRAGSGLISVLRAGSARQDKGEDPRADGVYRVTIGWSVPAIHGIRL
jgi:hypothetical protein